MFKNEIYIIIDYQPFKIIIGVRVSQKVKQKNNI